MRAAVTFHVYRSDDANPKQAWRWRAIARNGRIVADGGEGYATRHGAVSAVDRLLRFVVIGEARVVVSD